MGSLPRVGFEGGQVPFYLVIPKEPYYEGHSLRKQYPPLSLLQLQRLIDLGRVDPAQPVDLTTLCNTKLLNIDPVARHYGVNLTDEGADIFQACVNIEVQWTNELTIAAIERNGGTVTTKFYDLEALEAMRDPARFFLRGLPIPRVKLPPTDVLEFYSSAGSRGYLAQAEEVEVARHELAQKYGYTLPASTALIRKSPTQIWHGLQPGWVVNMRDRTILKPTDPEMKEYYES